MYFHGTSQQLRQDLRSCALNYFVETMGVQRLLRPGINTSDTALIGDLYESRCWIDRTGGADNQKHGGVFEFAIDAFHVQRNFTEPDDVRAYRLSAARTPRKICGDLMERLVRERDVTAHAA